MQGGESNPANGSQRPPPPSLVTFSSTLDSHFKGKKRVQCLTPKHHIKDWSFQTSVLVRALVDGRITEQRAALHPTLIKALNSNPAPTTLPPLQSVCTGPRHHSLPTRGRWARAVLSAWGLPGSSGAQGEVRAVTSYSHRSFISGLRSKDLNRARLLAQNTQQ